MIDDSIDFQFVVNNIATALEPHVRVVTNVTPPWNFVIVFSAILVMALNKHVFTQSFRMLLTAFYKSYDIDKTTRESNHVMSINGLLLTLTYVALLALVIQKTVTVFSGNFILFGGFDFYLEICTFIAAYLIIQHLIATFLGWLFGFEQAILHHETSHLSIITILNTVMTVLCLVILFYPQKIFLIIIISLILIMTGIRLFKLFFEIQFLSKLNYFNIFLYLCSLEIVPISVVITMLCRLVATNCVL